MRRIKIFTSDRRSLLITGASLDDLPRYLPSARLFIITDTNVRRLYGNRFPPGEIIAVEPGEQSKTLSVIGDLCKMLLDTGADRSSFILGFGGGVVCDIAGMVASVYMRGVRHGFVSTTLLSQVDASIGGKTGVNLGVYKNIIGTFRQPEFVICDHSLLSTLPEEEFQSGMGELIKHAVIGDRSLFFDISENLDRIYERETVVLEDLIYRAVRIKAAVVRHDPLEKGSRRVLNFGHTFGHVMETTYGLPHGLAVMKGMMVASSLSVWSRELPPAELHMLKAVMKKTGAPLEKKLPANVMNMISKDKKGIEESIYVVLLRAIGKAVIRKLPLTEIEAFVKYYRERENEV
jgi:3-dehydroquinate synthase